MGEEHYLAKISDELCSIRQLLEGQVGRTPWLSAEEVANRLGVSRDFVYSHQEELGAQPLSSGPRPRLRFDSRSVDGFLRSRPDGLGVEVSRRQRSSVPLLPVKGRNPEDLK